MELSEQEVKELEDLYYGNTTHEATKILSKKYGITWVDALALINKYKNELGWNKTIKVKWTDDELAILKEEVQKAGIKPGSDIACTKINKTAFACRKKARELELQKRDIELLEGEVFKHYKGYIYVSNKGRAYTTANKTNRILNPFKNHEGYIILSYNYEGKTHKINMHRAVAELFIPNPENKTQVDHIDTDRSNNCVENLRWVTPTENMNNELTRIHVSLRKGASSYGFNIHVIDNTTGEDIVLNSVAELYRHFGLTYIPKYVGKQSYLNYTIIMAGEERDEYYIGKMLRQGATKEELIEKVKNYSESAEYHKYLKQLKENDKERIH